METGLESSCVRRMVGHGLDSRQGLVVKGLVVKQKSDLNANDSCGIEYGRSVAWVREGDGHHNTRAKIHNEVKVQRREKYLFEVRAQ